MSDLCKKCQQEALINADTDSRESKSVVKDTSITYYTLTTTVPLLLLWFTILFISK